MNKFAQWLSKPSARRKKRLRNQRRQRLGLFEQLETRQVLANAIVAENMLPGSPASEWDIGQGIGDPAIQGFATDISVDQGETIEFKINNTAFAPYSIDIYRIGYYQGNGARLVDSIPASQTLIHSQPAPLYDASIGLLDAGNWSVSASWDVPETAVSGVYIARLRRVDTGGGSHIIFVVRDDDGGSDLLFQTSDTTWQAYNTWGGSSFYQGPFNGRTYALSYNRPFDTRGHTPKDWFFGPEYATVRWLEANGYDVSYTTGVDSARRGQEILEHKAFLSVGHDEYWSQEQRANVEAARDAGVHLAFFSGNEVYWKTRWESSIDGANEAFRTLISYKETWDDAKIDPLEDVWTGTWRDPRFSPPADGGRPENELTGQIFTVNRGPGGDTGTPFEVPYEYAAMRFWRDTRVADLQPGEVASVGDRVLGYEWNEDLDNGFRPAGLIRMSSTTQAVPEKIDEYGRRNVQQGVATHTLTLYRASSGAIVFGAGTINWGFGLDGVHDVVATTPDPAIQQATVNLFADMGVQPVTLQSGLVAATISTDVIAPTSTITSLAAGAILPAGVTVVLTGTASDEGGVIGGVEVSTDGGVSWRRAEGRTNWTYSFTPTKGGPATILTRAADDSGNIETPSGIDVSVQITPTSSSGLVAAYSFNQGTGTTLLDSSGNNHHGTVSGANWVTGFAGNALSFDGVNDMVSIADANSLDLTNGMTLEAWVRPVDLQGWATIIAKEAGSTNAYSLYASDDTNLPPSAYITTGGVERTVRANNPLPLNTWSHVAATYGNGQMQIYVNGQLVGSSNVTGSITSTSNPFRIGGNTVYEDEYFRGLIDEVRIYNRPLNIGEIQYNMSRPVGGSLDATPPTGSLVGLGGTVSGNVVIGANATDNIAVMGVQFLLNGQPVGLEDVSSPYQTNWNTATVANGTYQVSARIRDMAGNTFTTPATSVVVSNAPDVTAPSLVLQHPESGQLVSRTVLLAAVASDNVGVVGVRFQINGNDFGEEDTVAPYRMAWDTSGVAAGSHLITAIARDAAGNVTSRTVSVSVDNTAPTVIAQIPAPGTEGIAPGANATIAFSEPMQPGSINFRLENSAGVALLASVSYDEATRTATLNPQQDLQLGATYTARLLGARDLAGNAVAPMAWSFSTDTNVSNASLWDTSVVPLITSDPDTVPIELGVKFRTTLDGYITGMRFYKGAGNTGTHVGSLWTATGTRLATVTFTNETATGWQQANFGTPVEVVAGATYVVSYYAPNGRYAADPAYFTSGLVSGPLVVPDSSTAGGNGVYRYGSGGGFPTDSFNSTNYWVDVLFSNTLGDIVAPTITARTPAANATAVATGSNITATFSEAMEPASLAFVLRNTQGNVVPATVSYNSDNYTFTLDPQNALTDFSSYTVSLSGGQDLAGNAMLPVTWSFTTGGVDTTPPAISATTPATAATNVPPSQRIVATFNEPIDLNSITVTLTDGDNQEIPVGVFYDSVNYTAFVYLIPPDGLPGGCCGQCSHCPLLPSTNYTVRFAGVRDLSGNEMAPYTWSFTTADAIANQSIWNSQATPSVTAVPDTDAVELGVKFQATADGYITGLRFYKGAGNTGTHVARLWTAAGSVIGTATFTSETTTGWQQVNFNPPVFVAANTTYVASYYAPNGGYAFDAGYFNAGGVSNGPLRLLGNGEGGNGVFRYGAGGGFPNQSYNGSNYWVDVVYANSLGDVGAPQLIARTPAAGATGVASGATVSATFNEAVVSAALSFTLQSSSGATVPATWNYDANTLTATLTPSAPLASATTYTVQLSGVQDAAGNTLANQSWSFTTGGIVMNASLWNSAQTPDIASVDDTDAVELGVKFAADRDGYITGIRFYRGPANTGTQVGHLWSSNGTLLATATFAPGGNDGWQQVNFDIPVAITANTTYVASYFAPSGGYSVTPSYFASGAMVSGALRALGDSESGGNGVFRYGSTSGFPTNSFNAGNYWVDVVFSETLGDVTAPVVVNRTPTANARGVAWDQVVTATLSEPVVPQSIVMVLRDSGGNVVAANVAYDQASRTVTLSPQSPLAMATTYSVTLSGASDAAGNTLAETSWSFSTRGQWRQSSSTDFNAGSHNGTTTIADGDGAITLAPLFRDDFTGTSLGSAWQVSNWVGGGSATVSGDVLRVSGSVVTSSSPYVNQPVEGRVSFGTAAFLHFGLASGLNSVSDDSWAIFSTGGTTNTLFARVNAQGTVQDVNLGAIPSGMHIYRIEPTASGFAFSIDGVLRSTIPITFSASTVSRIAFSAYNTASPARLQVDWVGNPTLVATAVYQSAVFDAGAGASWQSISWNAQVPVGASLLVEVSFSDNLQSGWTNWTAVNNDVSLGGVVFRYARYRVTMSGSATLPPILYDLTMTWE